MTGIQTTQMATTPASINFEAKASSLIDATHGLTIAQVLVLRRMTMADQKTLQLTTPRQLQVIFEVILTKALERENRTDLLAARDAEYEPLLPPRSERTDEDREVLDKLFTRMFGPSVKIVADTEQAKFLANFEALLSRRLPPTPERVPRVHIPMREPQPLFLQQGGMRATGAGTGKRPKGPPGWQSAPTEADLHEEKQASVDFAALFDDTICGHIGKILDLLRIPSTDEPHSRIPFMVAPEFGSIFEDVMRRFILPTMRASRHIQTLAHSYNWTKVGGEQLIEIIYDSEVNNPILHNWDTRWNALKAETVKGAKETPWTLFRDDAKLNNYVGPERENIRLLLDIIRYEPDSIAKCWRELQQLYQQEFAPQGRQEHARDGAFRDGLLKWSDRLPDHLGEFLAIKASFTFPACTADYLRALLANYGRSEAERYRAAPFLSQYVADLYG